MKCIIISYGVGDCYSRSIVVPKQKIQILLSGKRGRRDETKVINFVPSIELYNLFLVKSSLHFSRQYMRVSSCDKADIMIILQVILPSH